MIHIHPHSMSYLLTHAPSSVLGTISSTVVLDKTENIACSVSFFRATVGGAPAKLTHDRSPIPSPAGQRLCEIANVQIKKHFLLAMPALQMAWRMSNHKWRQRKRSSPVTIDAPEWCVLVIHSENSGPSVFQVTTPRQTIEWSTLVQRVA